MPRPRVALAAIACALLLGVTACSPADADGPEASAVPPSAAAATDEPIFASDEEALAAAVEAYEAYSEMSELIVREGGVDPTRIEEVVGSEMASEHVREFEALQDAGLRIEGENRSFNARLAEYSENSKGATVSAYFCRDVSGTRVIDEANTDVTPDRSSISAVVAHFESKTVGSEVLILKDVDVWDDESFCV